MGIEICAWNPRSHRGGQGFKSPQLHESKATCVRGKREPGRLVMSAPGAEPPETPRCGGRAPRGAVGAPVAIGAGGCPGLRPTNQSWLPQLDAGDKDGANLGFEGSRRCRTAGWARTAGSTRSPTPKHGSSLAFAGGSREAVWSDDGIYGSGSGRAGKRPRPPQRHLAVLRT
jgi:hypothetical protein